MYSSFQIIVDTKASKTEMIAMQETLPDEINTKPQGLKVSLKDILAYLHCLLHIRAHTLIMLACF